MDKTSKKPRLGTRKHRSVGAGFCALGMVLAATGCSLDVANPAVPAPAASTPALSTPTITPGHDAAAVAAADMPFTAGAALAAGVPVGISDGLKEAPGWTLLVENVAGESQYRRADGCVVAAKVRTNQWPLVSTDDFASTVALFRYIDATILPEYLTTSTLRWGGEADKPGPAVEVLQLERPAAGGAKPMAVLARLFGTAGSSIYLSISCNDAGGVASARDEVRQWLLVVPPSN